MHHQITLEHRGNMLPMAVVGVNHMVALLKIHTVVMVVVHPVNLREQLLDMVLLQLLDSQVPTYHQLM
jgi:hypothetical protein